jgi:hypothetical protein
LPRPDQIQRANLVRYLNLNFVRRPDLRRDFAVRGVPPEEVLANLRPQYKALSQDHLETFLATIVSRRKPNLSHTDALSAALLGASRPLPCVPAKFPSPVRLQTSVNANRWSAGGKTELRGPGRFVN